MRNPNSPPAPGSLDGVTFTVIVHRDETGERWHARVDWGVETIHETQPAAPLKQTLRDARDAMLRFCRENGA